MNNWQSLLFYLVSFLLSTLLVALGETKKRKLLTILGLMIPILMAGFRYKVGTDYGTYLENVRDIAWHGGFSINKYLRLFASYLEPMFYLIAEVAIFLKNYQFIFIAYGAISVIFLYKAVKALEINEWPLVYFLIITILFPMSFNLTRQFAAITIAMYATALLIKGQTKKFFLLTIFAALFHVSAMITVLNYMIYKAMNRAGRPLTAQQKVILGVLLSAVGVLIIWYGWRRYGYLLRYKKATANLNFIPRLAMVLVVLSLRFKAPVIWQKRKILASIGLMSVILGLMGFFIRYSDRISLYFFPLVLALFPKALYQIIPWHKKYLTFIMVVAVGLFYFIASYYVLGSHQIMPYKIIFK